MVGRTKEEIEIDFYRAISSAQELESIADELMKIAGTHTDGAVQTLKNSWRGGNGEDFVKKAEVLSGDMYETAEDIIKVAKNIRSTADIVYRAEKAAVYLSYK